MSVYTQRYEQYDAVGNRVIVFITHNKDESSAALFDMALLPALNHFGIPYRTIDVSTAAFSGVLSDAAAVVLSHDGVAAALSDSQWDEIVAAVESGLGTASFDGELWRAKEEIRMFFGGRHMNAMKITAVVIPETSHYILEMQATSKTHTLRKSVQAAVPEAMEEGFTPIARDNNGNILVTACHSRTHSANGSNGRRVAIYFSPALWMKQHFGHAMGLDDLLWRSLIWIAKKPFVALMMLPFAVCRIDDAIGSYDHFEYVKVLNRYQWIPNIGLFVDEIDNESASAIKFFYDRRLAEFSAHSFHELGEPLPDQIYLKHDGSEYSFEELQTHFEKLDRFYDQVGIRPSSTVNIHYDELGLNSLPFLLRRKQTFMMALIPFGVHWYANSYSWEPYPYGNQGFNYGSMDPDHRFWNVIAHHLGGYKTPDTQMGVGEFLGGCTVFNGENSINDVEQAIARGAEAVKIGVASGFFGTLMTHEQRIAVLRPEEWRAIISGISRALERWPLIYESYDNISLYCKDKARTRIAKADSDSTYGRMTLELEGTVERGICCYVFEDNAAGTDYRFVQVPPFTGRMRLTECKGNEGYIHDYDQSQ